MVLILSHPAQTGHVTLLSWDICLSTEKIQCSKEHSLENKNAAFYAGLYLGVIPVLHILHLMCMIIAHKYDWL